MNKEQTMNSNPTGQIGVTLGPDLHAKIQKMADEDDRSVSNMVRVILIRHVRAAEANA